MAMLQVDVEMATVAGAETCGTTKNTPTSRDGQTERLNTQHLDLMNPYHSGTRR